MTRRIVTARERVEMLSPWVREAISREDLDDYRAERHRQEVELENATGGYAADVKDYFDRGGKPLITFKDWLKGRAGGQADREAWESSLPPVMPWDPPGATGAFNDLPEGGPVWDEPGYTYPEEPPEELRRWARMRGLARGQN